ncbi:2-aminoethylphosphonate--pyruvate transaminase [Rapidithrix thailandica]|uniref:2-aminoethylphosphonate--pyruvate transaminase n=1 Tax=Rapidithrix thailandica TaxID=413964 RepID=A0AAW9S1G9_9BACT
MEQHQAADNHYLLLTPGPLTTSDTVKQTMLKDWCTWDNDYKEIVQEIRQSLLQITGLDQTYTSVLMQGSGTFSVESVIGSVLPPDGKLLILTNGAYGDRIVKIATHLRIDHTVYQRTENEIHSTEQLDLLLQEDPAISHVVVVHCETTTGILNPIEQFAPVVKQHGKTFIVDAMSSLGGIPIDIKGLQIDFIISSANKCIQGVPGFGFVLAKKEALEECKTYARSLSLDLYDQWAAMEQDPGKWRYTSPTHVVRAFRQALWELIEEGGIEARYQRYKENHRILVQGMNALGFQCLVDEENQSPIITSFVNPSASVYNFQQFYNLLKEKGFVIYPGKVSYADTFRIGNIGHVFPEDMERLVSSIRASMFWK